MPSQVGISGDLAASEVSQLRKSVGEFSDQASKQTKQMLQLTRVLTWLTGIMTLLVVVQICLAIFK
jgi:hypothetical protein